MSQAGGAGGGATPTTPGATPAGGGATPTPGTSLGADERAIAQVNAELNKTADNFHVNSIGGSALKAWVKSNNIIERNGGYWQNRQLPNGQQALVKSAAISLPSLSPCSSWWKSLVCGY